MGLPTLVMAAAIVAQLRAGTPIDSARLVRSARAAQASFEAFRRNRLPRGESHGETCDVRIGRYCYWRGDDEPDDPPPEEVPAVRERRAALIQTLDSAAAALPGDAWIAGQRVRYLVEMGRTDEAIGAARACRAEASWCSALAGYAAHSAGSFAIADSAYRVALDAMGDADRCRWLDVSDLLDGELGDRYDKLDCKGREILARRMFWLGSPLFSVSTSDLLTEHFARITRARIAEHSASADGEAWADDERALTLRYGWPRWYTRTEPNVGSMRSASITGHDSGKPYNFIPSLRAIEHLGQIGDDDWQLDNARAITGYAPAFAKSMHDVPSQIAAFRRGESTLVVAAWDVRKDTTLVGRDLDVALVLADTGLRVTQRAEKSRAVGRITALGVLDSGVVSLELLSPENHRAGRKRVGLPARTGGAMALSDLLLYSGNADEVPDLAAARDSALATNVLPMSRNLGVFWETYGLDANGKPARFTLSIEPVGTSWIRRAAEQMHITDPTRAVRIEWQEAPSVVNGIASRGIKVDLSKLRGGRYRLHLTVTPSTGWPATAQREIEVP